PRWTESQLEPGNDLEGLGGCFTRCGVVMEIKGSCAREGIGHHGTLKCDVALRTESHCRRIDRPDKCAARPFQTRAGRKSNQPVLRGRVAKTRDVFGDVERSSSEKKLQTRQIR